RRQARARAQPTLVQIVENNPNRTVHVNPDRVSSTARNCETYLTIAVPVPKSRTDANDTIASIMDHAPYTSGPRAISNRGVRTRYTTSCAANRVLFAAVPFAISLTE